MRTKVTLRVKLNRLPELNFSKIEVKEIRQENDKDFIIQGTIDSRNIVGLQRLFWDDQEVLMNK